MLMTDVYSDLYYEHQTDCIPAFSIIAPGYGSLLTVYQQYTKSILPTVFISGGEV